MTTIQNSPVSGDRPPVLLRTQEVVRVTTLARSSIYRLVSAGKFPPPIPLTEGGRTAAKAWLKAEVDAWLEARIAARNQKWEAAA